MALYQPADPNNFLEAVQITDFDLPASRRLQYIFHNTTGVDANSPNDAHAWVGLHVPWPDQTVRFGWQIVARYQDNPKGLWWRQTLNQEGLPWYRIADEEAGIWTPTIGGTLTNGTSHNYTTQIGRWFRQGSVVRLNFRVKGTFSSTPNRPTGSPTIRSLPFTAKNESGFWWSNVALQSNIGAEGISGIPIFTIKHNENFMRFQLNYSGVNGNTEYEGVNSNIWNSAGSNFDFAGDLSYQIN